jgi:hypothetical protein
MRPSVFFADPINDTARPQHLDPQNRLIVRVQSNSALVEEADVLLLTVANDAEAATTVGAATMVGPTTNVRATLALNATCPLAQAQLELDGTMTFSHFGSATAGAASTNNFNIQFGDQLSATFSFDVVDRRQATLGGIGGVPTTAAVAGHLDGNFDFIVRQGRAAQTF